MQIDAIEEDRVLRLIFRADVLLCLDERSRTAKARLGKIALGGVRGAHCHRIDFLYRRA